MELEATIQEEDDLLAKRKKTEVRFTFRIHIV